MQINAAKKRVEFMVNTCFNGGGCMPPLYTPEASKGSNKCEISGWIRERARADRISC